MIQTFFHRTTEPLFKHVISDIKEKLGDQILKATIISNRIIIHYKTKAGYYTQAIFDQNGNCLIKKYYKVFNQSTGAFSEYLFTKTFPAI